MQSTAKSSMSEVFVCCRKWKCRLQTSQLWSGPRTENLLTTQSLRSAAWSWSRVREKHYYLVGGQRLELERCEREKLQRWRPGYQPNAVNVVLPIGERRLQNARYLVHVWDEFLQFSDSLADLCSPHLGSNDQHISQLLRDILEIKEILYKQVCIH